MLPPEPVRTVLLDIEGTTTPLAFVHDTLFPYARSHVKGFLEQHLASADVRADLTSLQQEHLADVGAALNPPKLDCDSPRSQLESTIAYIEWLMDRDRKSTALKSLQGRAGGMVRPSALAVLRLIVNRKRVGCSNGSCSGFAPLRMRSIRPATRSCISPISGPYDIKPPSRTSLPNS